MSILNRLHIILVIILTYIFLFGLATANNTYAVQCGGSGNCHESLWGCYYGGAGGGICAEDEPGCVCGYYAGEINGTVGCKNQYADSCDPGACGNSGSIPGTNNCYPISSGGGGGGGGPAPTSAPAPTTIPCSWWPQRYCECQNGGTSWLSYERLRTGDCEDYINQQSGSCSAGSTCYERNGSTDCGCTVPATPTPKPGVTCNPPVCTNISFGCSGGFLATQSCNDSSIRTTCDPVACPNNAPTPTPPPPGVPTPTPRPPVLGCTPGNSVCSPVCRKCDVNGVYQPDYTGCDYHTCFCADNPSDPTCGGGTSVGDVPPPPCSGYSVSCSGLVAYNVTNTGVGPEPIVYAKGKGIGTDPYATTFTDTNTIIGKPGDVIAISQFKGGVDAHNPDIGIMGFGSAYNYSQFIIRDKNKPSLGTGADVIGMCLMSAREQSFCLNGISQWLFASDAEKNQFNNGTSSIDWIYGLNWPYPGTQPQPTNFNQFVSVKLDKRTFDVTKSINGNAPERYKGLCTESGNVACCAKSSTCYYGAGPVPCADEKGIYTLCTNPGEDTSGGCGEGDPRRFDPPECRYNDNGFVQSPGEISHRRTIRKKFDNAGTYMVEGVSAFCAGNNEANHCAVQIQIVGTNGSFDNACNATTSGYSCRSRCSSNKGCAETGAYFSSTPDCGTPSPLPSYFANQACGPKGLGDDAWCAGTPPVTYACTKLCSSSVGCAQTGSYQSYTAACDSPVGSPKYTRDITCGPKNLGDDALCKDPLLVEGWAYDERYPGTELWVRIKEGATILKTFQANQFSQKLKDESKCTTAAKTSGYCAFSQKLDPNTLSTAVTLHTFTTEVQDPSDGSWKPLGSSITAACKDLSPVTISGQLINDNNDNAGPDTGENVYTGNATITIDPPVGGSAVPSWNAAHDTYTFTGAVPGTVYTLSVNVNGVPNRYVSTVVPLSIPLGVNAPSFAVQDIYIGRLYQITGKVFEDTDKDKEFNNPAHTPPDALFTKGGSVRITGTGVDTTAPVNTTTAVYLITGLKASIPYTLTYTPPAPPDFKGFTPLINPYVAVSTGPDNCPSMIAAQKFGTLCDNTTFPTVNGDIKELNFPITNSTPWIQYVGSNVRVDSGFANPVPKTVNPTCQDPNADPASNPLNKPYSVNTK